MRMRGSRGAQVEDATIDGIAVTGLLAYWRGGCGANGA